MKIKKIKIILALFIITSLQLTSCKNDSKTGAAASMQQNAVKPYPVQVLSEQPTTLYVDYPATIKGTQDIEIRPMLEGFIKTIEVDEGSTVRKGQVLFTLDAPQYQQNKLNALAAIKTAEADLNNAKMEVRKVTPLVEKGIVSKYQLEAAKYALEAKQAALNQAYTTLANAETNVSYTRIVSPVNGSIGSIPYRLGSLVNSSTTLTTVANTADVYVYFSINEKQLLDLLKTLPGKTQNEKLKHIEPVKLILSTGTEYIDSGRIDAISGIINTGTAAANMRAIFPNTQGILKSGLSGTVRITNTIKNALIIPQKATYEIQGITFVYVVQNDNKVKQVSIKVTPTPDGKSYVVDSGLKANDKIVINGIQNLKDGMEIKPQL